MINHEDQFNLSSLIRNQSDNIAVMSVDYSNLGGNENASLIVKATTQEKNQWINGIFHNSPYSMFSVSFNHHKNRYVIEQFSKGTNVPKFRKTSTAKTLADVGYKIATFFNF